ncbi:unnamed protein product [Periconia digitata]|uniref:Secreted protein n=1 Tax=Periconia digitata TaxID=1303443 RepID=A0A9W4XQG4_9PLEO|nr:unnamed protein product [Periconia digitata]
MMVVAMMLLLLMMIQVRVSTVCTAYIQVIACLLACLLGRNHTHPSIHPSTRRRRYSQSINSQSPPCTHPTTLSNARLTAGWSFTCIVVVLSLAESPPSLTLTTNPSLSWL